MCPDGVRVAAWIKGARSGKAWFPRSSWEPLIIHRGRPRFLSVTEYSCDSLQWGGRQHIFHQLLAQHGVIVWILDNRSASGSRPTHAAISSLRSRRISAAFLPIRARS